MTSPIALLVALVLVLGGCAVRPPAVTQQVPAAAGAESPRPLVRRAAQRTSYAPQQTGLAPEELASIDWNCPFGAPAADPQWDHGPTQIVSRAGYALRHSSIDLIPLWVCEGIERAQLDGPLRRPDSDPFESDPLLPAELRAELDDYDRSGYDRGHLAASANQTMDAQLQAETFYLSNVAPQIGVGFNRHIWARLESLARKWIQRAGRGFIVTGPLFYDPSEEEVDTADGFVEYETIGYNAVAVPTHFYKIVLVSDGAGWRAIAFVLENRRHYGPDLFEQHVKSIDWVEERTGLDFMPNLGLLQQQQLEARPSPMWPQQ